MSNVKSIGIIGMGMLGKAHAKVALEHPSVKLTAVCDLYESQTKDLVEKNPGLKSYTSYEEMLKNEKFDIVVVATQDPLHKDPLLAVIGAGVKEIICEKPLTTTLEEADIVKKAAEAAGASIYLCFMLRMGANNRAIHTLVKGGYLGKLLHGEWVNDDSIHVPTKYWGDKSAEWAKSSSPIQFLFSHSIDGLRYMFGPAEVTKVYALGKQEGTGSVVDYCEALLTWSDGSVIRIKTDWMRKITGLTEHCSAYTFEDAGIIMRPDAMGASQFRIDFLEKEKMEKAADALMAEGFNIRMETAPKAFAQYSIIVLGDSSGRRGGFPASSYIIDYILGDKTNEAEIVDLAGGYKQVKVVDAIFKSMELDRPIEIKY